MVAGFSCSNVLFRGTEEFYFFFFFNWYFVMSSSSAPAGTFQFSQAQVFVFVLTAFVYVYSAFTSLVIFVELCTFLCYDVIALKFR